MSSPSQAAAWTCPSCRRHVPPRVTACRCGFLHADLPRTASPTATDARRPSGLLLVVGGLLVGGAVMYVLTRPAPPAADPQATVRAEPAVPADGPALHAGEEPRPDTAPGAPANAVPTGPPPIAPLPAMPAPAAAAIRPETPRSLEEVIGNVLPAVASITAGQARGTGFFVRADQVLTNAHVIEGQTSVRLHVGGADYTARVASVSEGTDLAVLQVYGARAEQPVLRLGTASGARVGQEVVAIGSALGVLSNTVTRGIVSAVRRVGDITLLQTDAAINPGNSGGPLIDRNGTVIGINSMAVAAREGQGLAFAVAIDHATPLLNGQGGGTSRQTPLTALSEAMGGPAESDVRRAQGEQVYAQTLQAAAQRADQLDAYWSEYATSCVASAPRSGDRPWFAVYEKQAIRLSATSNLDCQGWLSSVEEYALPVRDALRQAAEVARRSGVYPGAMRDLRRQYRMNWSGWDR